MASLRGSQYLWNNVAAVQNDESLMANVGPGPHVTIYISAVAAATFKLQVAAVVGPSAGRNAIDTTIDDGGLSWHDLDGKTVLTIPASGKIAFDLSPFGPPYLRLVRTDAGAGNVTAIASWFGPN